MSDNIRFTELGDFLLVTIQDKIITYDRAQEILARTGKKCANIKCNTVLLDEMSVQKRDVSPKDIEYLALDSVNNNLNKIYMAFLCQPHLMDFDSNMLSLYTSIYEFITQHFSIKEEAITWLKKKHNS